MDLAEVAGDTCVEAISARGLVGLVPAEVGLTLIMDFANVAAGDTWVKVMSVGGFVGKINEVWRR